MTNSHNNLKDIINYINDEKLSLAEDVILYISLEVAQQHRINCEHNPNILVNLGLENIQISQEAEIVLLPDEDYKKNPLIALANVVLELYEASDKKNCKSLIQLATKTKNGDITDLLVYISELKKIKKTELVNPNVLKKVRVLLSKININAPEKTGNVVSFESGKKKIFILNQIKSIKLNQMAKSAVVFSFVAICLSVVFTMNSDQSGRNIASIKHKSFHNYEVKSLIDKGDFLLAERKLDSVPKENRNSEWQQLIEDLSINKVKKTMKLKDKSKIKKMIQDLENKYGFLKQSEAFNKLK